MGPEAMILGFGMLNFKPAFSLSSFTLIKRFFSSSSLSAIRLESSIYLMSLIFPPAVLIPVCDSSSLTFCLMYSAYKLKKQGDYIRPSHTSFPIWILEWIAIPFSRASSQLQWSSWVTALQADCLPSEPSGKLCAYWLLLYFLWRN